MESLDGEVVALRRALFLAPTDVQLHTQLGDVYLNCCDFRSAVHSYANALSLSPDDIGVRRRLAAAHCILGKLCRDTDLASALENFRHALRLQPDNLFYTLHVIRCHVQLSNFRPSLPLLNTLIARLGFRELEEQFRWHLVDIRSVRNALLENIPKQTLPMLLEVLALRAEVFLKIEKPTLAHNDVEAGLLLKPQHDKLLALRERLQQVARDLLNVGIAASLAGQLDKATLQLSRSLFLQPYNVRTYWHRARSFRLRKIFDRALEDLDSGLYLQQKKMRGHDINNALLDPLAPPPRADDGAMGALDMATSPQQPAAASPMNPLSSGLPAGMTAHPSISAAPRPASSPLSSAPPLPLPVDSKGSVNSALPGLDVASANQEDTGGDAKPASRQLTVATQDTEQDSASGSRVRTLNACAPKHNTPPTGTPAGTTPTSDPTTPATPTTPAPAMPATPATPATPAMPVVASAEHGSETPQLFPRSSTLLRLTAPSPMKPRPLIDTQSTPSPHASQPAGDALQTGSLAFARLLTPLSVPADAPVFPAPTQPWRARQHNLLRRRASAILLRPSPGALHEAQQNFSRQLREHSPAPPPGAADNSGKARHTLKHARSTPLLSHTPHGTDDQPEHLHARPSRQRHSSARPSRGAASPALTRVVTLRRNLQARRSLVSDFIGQGLGDVGRDAGDTAAIPAAAPSTGDNADTQGGVDELDVPREQALQAMLSEQTKATAVATEPGGSHQAAGDRTDSERQPHAAVTVAVAAGPSSSVAGAGSEWAGGPGVLSPLAWRAHQPAAVGSQGAGGGTRSAQQWSVGASGAPVMDMLGGADSVENEEKRRQEQKEEEREEEEDEDEEDEEVRRDDCQALEVSSADQPVVSEDEALAAALYQELALTFNDQGLAFFSTKKFALAAECLSRSVVLQPDVAAHIMTRGDCFSAMGELDRALADYTEAFRKPYPKEAVLPVVIHLDEHNAFIRNFAAGQHVAMDKAIDFFKKNFLQALALYMGRARGPTWRNFIIPVVSGTSGPDVKNGMPSSFRTTHIPLTPLSLKDSFKMASQGLGFKLRKQRPTRKKAMMDDNYFRMAVADCGGLPGFIHHLVTQQKPKNGDWQTAVGGLEDYVSSESVPAEALARVTSIVLSQCAVKRNTVLCDAPEKKTTLLDLERIGCVHLTGDLGADAKVTVRTPIPILKVWLQRIIKDGLEPPIHGRLLAYPCRGHDWTWEDFERLMVSATRLRINDLVRYGPQRTCLQDIFPGAQGDPDVLQAPITLIPVEEAEEHRQCVPKRKANEKAMIKWDALKKDVKCKGIGGKKNIFKTILQCATGNKLVDARIAFCQAGKNKKNKSLLVLVQYKHSKQDSKTTVTEEQITQWHDDLDAMLEDVKKYADVVLIKITNRRRTGGTDELKKRKGLVWVTQAELGKLNPFLAHRGLLPTDHPVLPKASHSRANSEDSHVGVSPDNSPQKEHKGDDEEDIVDEEDNENSKGKRKRIVQVDAQASPGTPRRSKRLKNRERALRLGNRED